MPEISLGHMVPSPVGLFNVLKDNAGVVILGGGIAPDVKVAPAASWLGPARALKPRMLVGSVVENQFRDDPQSAAMRFAQKRLEVRERSVMGMDRAIVRYVVTVVLERPLKDDG